MALHWKLVYFAQKVFSTLPPPLNKWQVLGTKCRFAITGPSLPSARTSCGQVVDKKWPGDVTKKTHTLEMCGLLLLPSLDHCVWSPVLLIQCVDEQDWCSSREQKRGGRSSWILCHHYASQLAISPLLPVGCLISWGAVYRARSLFRFKWNNKCEAERAPMRFFQVNPSYQMLAVLSSAAWRSQNCVMKSILFYYQTTTLSAVKT